MTTDGEVDLPWPASEKTRRVIRWTVSLVVMLLAWACARPQRPPSVPRDAVFVQAYSSGLWVHCWYDEAKQIHYRFHNGLGRAIPSVGVLEDVDDDVYVLYDPSISVSPEDLRHLDRRTGATIVWLANGAILVPRHNNDLYRREVEFMLHRAASLR